MFRSAPASAVIPTFKNPRLNAQGPENTGAWALRGWPTPRQFRTDPNPHRTAPVNRHVTRACGPPSGQLKGFGMDEYRGYRTNRELREELGVSRFAIRRAAMAVGVTPAVTVRGVGLFTAADADRIRRHVRLTQRLRPSMKGAA
jgi:hypothetical protein